ncbi:protogenin B-like isoform X2 [Venturia canescens]|uniref:protogenin B-like isoform X2 n=1 Tax=Venturia canescens TaxID=32260 RepID=UPI001C9BD28F|nr:protogenin B-like isoform X2 [Venturia canescens]
MAARVLLLGILFTEVLEPVCTAGVRGSSGVYSSKNGSKIEGSDLGLTKYSDFSLGIEPGGTVVLGKRGVTLSCQSSGNDQDISWLHNGVPAPPCGIARCGLLYNGSLHIYKLSQKSKGRESFSSVSGKGSKKHEYRCVARVSSGGYLRSAPTIVQVAELSHNFKESPEDMTVGEGEIARFSCLIDSIPFPANITWQHNGETLNIDRNSTKYYFVRPGVLYISSTKLSDAGSYRCTAANDHIKKTKKSKEAKLTVNVASRTNEPAIPISLFPQISYTHRLMNGSNISLACAASGYPSTTVTWTFFPRYSDGPAVPRILLNSTKGIAILALENVSLSNAGIYSCSTKNSDIQNITIDIMVPPSFLKKPTSQSFPNGRTVRFKCQAQGTPTPKIYWLKDSANITTNGRRTTYEKEQNKMDLAISATVPSDSGIYQCVAVNAAGEIWAAGHLQVNTSRHSPAAPTSLKCHAPSPSKIFISWEPPKSLESTRITAYTVHYRPEDGGQEEISPPEPGNSTSVEVTKLLEPFTNYSFYVRVWNNHGASDQSATIVCSTAASVPKAVPKIRVEPLDSTKINASWEPLSSKEARGVIEEYKLQWRLDDQQAWRVHFLPATVRHYVITDLLPGARYHFRVLARTSQGWPNMSETQLGWTSVVLPPLETDKPKLRNFVYVQITRFNASTIKMSWNWKEKWQNHLPTLNHGDSWRIHSDYNNGDKLTVTLPINTTEYLFTSLETNVSYTMDLCMIDSGVEIDCLTETIESTQAISDNVPSALQASQISSTKILLTWEISNINEGQTYEICYQPVYEPDPERTQCIFVHDSKLVIIDQLKPFTMYQFKMRSVGNGTIQMEEFSDSIECYTSEDVPGKPEDVQWFIGNGTNAKIAWKQPTETNGVIQNYFVSYTSDLTESTLTWGNVTVPGNKTSVTLSDLLTGKRYDVMVQAATKAGYGRPSDPIFIITGGNSSPSKGPTKTDEQKPPQKTKPDQSLGIIIGVSISICCITVCLCSMYCRKKCENSRSLRESSQSQKSRALMRRSNGCCVERSATPVIQQMTPQIVRNEIELAELCASSPTSTNPQCDTKGGHPNGVLENCVKEPLLTPWNSSHDESKDLRITENPQCKQSGGSPVSNRQEPDSVLNITELTMMDCTLAGSDNSLNNNLGCRNASPRKTVPIAMPVLEPNG